MNRLVATVVRDRVASNLLMVGLLAAGAFSMTSLDVRLFPELVPNEIRITVPYPGATPEEIEASIVEPIEERVEGIDGIDEIRSQATSDLGQVTVSLIRGADRREKLDEIEAAVDRISALPRGSEEPDIFEVEAREQILQLVVAADLPADATGMRTVKDLAERVRDDITALSGVSQAEVSGVPDDLLEVTVDRATLDAYGTTLADLARRIGAGSRDLSAGELETGDDRLLVRTLGENETAPAIADVIVLTSGDGTGVRLGEIAEVRDGFEDTARRTLLDGRPAALVSVYRSGDERVLELVDAVQAYLEDRLTPTLPESLTVTVWRNDGELLRGRLRLLLENGAIGLVLVLVVLTLFLEIRVAAWVALGIGVAFVGTTALMTLFGVALNVISLFGFILAIGIVVDDAIVVGENVHLRRPKGDDGASEDAVESAIGATQRVLRPVLFAVSTTIVAFVPLLFLPGTIGQFVEQIAAIVIFTLLLSLLESFFVLPHHLAGIRPGAPAAWSPRRLTDPVRARFDRALSAFADGPLRRAVGTSVAHPHFALACATMLLALTLALPAGGWLEFVFFPQVQGNYVTARVELPRNTPEGETLEAAEALESAAHAAAERVAARHGLTADQVLDGLLLSVGGLARAPDPGENRPAGARPQFASISARIMDAEVRPFDAEEFSAAWRAATPPIAGLRERAFSSSLVNIGAPIALEVSADSEATVDRAIRRLRDALASLDGVHDVRDDRNRATDEITLALRPEARSFGLELADLATAVRDALFGAEALRVQRGREEVEVRVRLPEHERDSLAALRAYEVPTPAGDRLPLATVAEIGERPAPARIDRRDGRRITTLSADTNPEATPGGEAMTFLMSEVVPELRRAHPDLSVAVAGEQEERSRTLPQLARNFALALFAIYALMALAFGAYTQPLVILATVPFGLVGAVTGHLLLGLNLTFLSIFGLIGLAGVIVNDALLIVDFFNEKVRDGMDRARAVTEATLDRFRPILLTSLTTFFGVAPLMLETSVQAQFLIPTAVSLGFGILFGTCVLMLVVPALLRVQDGLVARLGSSAAEAEERRSGASEGRARSA